MTKETVELNIRVTDSYIAFRMEGSNHPTLVAGVWLYLINNEARDCYFFASGKDTNLPSSLLAQGKYAFSVEKDGETATPYLSLSYPADENGKFTLADIAPSQHKFNILGSTGYIYDIIREFLDIDWNKVSKAQQNRDIQNVFNLNMNEVDSDYKIVSTLSSAYIPENILK